MHVIALAVLVALALCYSITAFRLPASPLRRQMIRETRMSSAAASCQFPVDIERCAFNGRGTVLLVKPEEREHAMQKSAVLIIEHTTKGSQGVILNRPNAFPLGDAAPGMGIFASNKLYMGGNDGADTAIMIHKFDFDGAAKHLGNGIYVGGLRQARELVEAFKATPKDFRFIFNNVAWAAGALDREVEQGRWEVCKVLPDRLVKEPDLWTYAYETNS
jgi:putative transcriptional regulator